jgi:hypothetical protein
MIWASPSGAASSSSAMAGASVANGRARPTARGQVRGLGVADRRREPRLITELGEVQARPPRARQRGSGAGRARHAVSRARGDGRRLVLPRHLLVLARRFDRQVPLGRRASVLARRHTGPAHERTVERADLREPKAERDLRDRDPSDRAATPARCRRAPRQAAPAPRCRARAGGAAASAARRRAGRAAAATVGVPSSMTAWTAARACATGSSGAGSARTSRRA